MLDHLPNHKACVDAWLARTCEGLKTPDQFVREFHGAFMTLWKRSGSRLGEVTLMAICDRVLHDGRSHFPFLETVTVNGGGLSVDRLTIEATTLDHAQVKLACCTLLIEFLTILGRLTAEVLTPALHAELSPRETGPS